MTVTIIIVCVQSTILHKEMCIVQFTTVDTIKVSFSFKRCVFQDGGRFEAWCILPEVS